MVHPDVLEPLAMDDGIIYQPNTNSKYYLFGLMFA